MELAAGGFDPRSRTFSRPFTLRAEMGRMPRNPRCGRICSLFGALGGFGVEMPFLKLFPLTLAFHAISLFGKNTSKIHPIPIRVGIIELEPFSGRIWGSKSARHPPSLCGGGWSSTFGTAVYVAEPGRHKLSRPTRLRRQTGIFSNVGSNPSGKIWPPTLLRES